MLIAMPIGTIPIWGIMMYTKFFDPEYEAMMHESFWLYNGPLCMISFVYVMMNVTFMDIARVDALKRKLMMLRLSQVIDL